MRIPKSEIVPRYANAIDFGAINAVFNEAFQRRRSLDEFHWKFLASPRAGAVPVAVVATIDDQIVGIFGLLPHRLSIHGQLVDAVQVLDVCVLPQFRYFGVNRATLNCFLRTASNYGRLAFGFPGDLYAAVGLEKLGYQRLTSLVAYEWDCELGLSKDLFEESPEFVVVESETIPAEWPNFFTAMTSQFGVKTHRTMEYLRWRYQSFSHRRFVRLSVRSTEGIEGLAVVGILGNASDPKVWIYEFLAKQPAAVFTLLRYVLRTLSLDAARKVSYWCSEQVPWQQEFKIMGFRKLIDCENQVVGLILGEPKSDLDVCFNPSEWYLTLGDSDL